MIFGRIWGQGVEFFGLGVLVDWFLVSEWGGLMGDDGVVMIDWITAMLPMQ